MRRGLVVCTLLLALASSASATLTFFFSLGPAPDTSGFDTAVAGIPFLGAEDFENNTFGASGFAVFPDPLLPGVSNGPFASGLVNLAGMSIQANTLANPTVPSPSGAGNALAAAKNVSGTPGTQIGTGASTAHSLDLIFPGPGVDAVSFTPIFADVAAAGVDGPMEVRVYDTSNVLLSPSPLVFMGGDFQDAHDFVGIFASAGDRIGRVNLDHASVGGDFVGIDNVGVYSVPEPATVGLMAVGFLLLGLLWARQHSKES